MAARLLLHRKRTYDDGSLSEIKLWELPRPVAGSAHTLKYSLYYGKSGVRLIGYDNERGKGDHRHYGDREEAYSFVDLRTLIADFRSDVRRVRGESDDG
jgi:hypothetical protein